MHELPLNERLNVRVRVSPEVIAQEVQLGETLLLNTKTLVYFGLDPLGSSFWAALGETPDARSALAKVAADTGRPQHELAKPLATILEAMERSGLIERIPV